MDEDLSDTLFYLLTEHYNDKIDKNKDLEEYLREENKKQLLAVYVIYLWIENMKDIVEQITKLKKMKKQETISKIIEFLDNNFDKIMEIINEKRFEETKLIAKNNDFFSIGKNLENEISLGTIILLNKLGFIYVKKEGDELLIHMPEYIKNKINKIDKCIYLPLYDKVIKYSIGMAKTYGAIEINDAYNIIKRDINITEKEYLDIIGLFSILELEPIYFSIENQAICDFDIHDDEAKELLSKNRKYVIYDKEFYKNMENDNYLENLPQYKQFRNYLKKLYCFDINEDIFLKGEIVKDYISFCQIDEKNAVIFIKQAIDRYFEDYDNVEVNIIIGYVNKIRENMPNWKKGGKIENEVKDKKIGRNDKCSCGSGKKYKNCCGKNN